MPVLGYRSPQQKQIVISIYQSWLKHHGFTGGAQAQTLLEPPTGTTEYPFIYTLNAPTGWGKSLVSMEPIRWITSAISADDDLNERWVPELPDDFDPTVLGLREDYTKGQLIRKVAELVMTSPDEDGDDGFMELPADSALAKVQQQFKAGMLDFPGEGDHLPVQVSGGAVAVYVRTRSQTQAFLRESRRYGLNAIALPSKASVCMCNRVPLASDEDSKIGIDSLPNFESDTAFRQALDDTASPELFYKNPTSDITPYDPQQHPHAARLHSHASDQCSQCPLNLSVQERMRRDKEMNGVEPEGRWAEDYMIFRSGMTDSESYVSEVVKYQQETQDLEESTKMLWANHPTICPYPSIRNSLPDFDFLILTYPYLFSPSISRAMSDYLGHVEHVLVDEAHNISQLYGQLTKYVWPGASSNNDRLSSALYDFDVIPTMHLEPIKKDMERGLFKGANKYEVALSSHIAEHYPQTDSELAKKRAKRDLEEQGVFDPSEIVAIYDNANEHVKLLAVWFAMVQHRYMGWYGKLVETKGEQNIQAGFEPQPQEMLDFLFGHSALDKLMLEGEGTADGDELYFTQFANTPAGKSLRTKTLSINNVLRAVRHLTKLQDSERLNELAKAADRRIATVAIQIRKLAKASVEYAEELLSLVKALTCVHPEPMANWFIDNGVDSRLIETEFVRNNPYVFDQEGTLQYFMNGHINWLQIMALLRSLQAIASDFADEYQAAREAGEHEEYEGEHLGSHLRVYFQGIESARQLPKPEAIKELLKSIEEAYNATALTQEHVTLLQELGMTHFPTYQYQNEFPFTDWKIYYRYWDGYFEVTPITIGRLLGVQLSKYKTVGLVSGTFPPIQYMQAFWGINPYAFNVTEKIGQMDFTLVRGVSSKFDQRQFSYDKWAQLIAQVYRQSSSRKSVLAVFPSRAVAGEVTQRLSYLLSHDEYWSSIDENNESLDVNDMLDELTDIVDRDHRKVFLVTMGSRFTEGVEYVDSDGSSMLDAVIICGIQYPARDIHVDNMQLYVEEKFGLDNRQAFELVQTEQAYQKVRQAAGRGVRSQVDVTTVYLADNRYSQQFWQTRMPTLQHIDL